MGAGDRDGDSAGPATGSAGGSNTSAVVGASTVVAASGTVVAARGTSHDGVGASGDGSASSGASSGANSLSVTLAVVGSGLVLLEATSLDTGSEGNDGNGSELHFDGWMELKRMSQRMKAAIVLISCS